MDFFIAELPQVTAFEWYPWPWYFVGLQQNNPYFPWGKNSYLKADREVRLWNMGAERWEVSFVRRLRLWVFGSTFFTPPKTNQCPLKTGPFQTESSKKGAISYGKPCLPTTSFLFFRGTCSFLQGGNIFSFKESTVPNCWKKNKKQGNQQYLMTSKRHGEKQQKKHQKIHPK